MIETHQRIANSFATQGLMRTLGATLAWVGDGEVHIALPFSTHISQQLGYVHAGAISSILDSACGYAALTRARHGWDVVTAEFKINLLRPALGQHFLAIGRVQNAGKSLTVCTGEVRAFTTLTAAAATAGAEAAYKVVALMQATVANIQP